MASIPRGHVSRDKPDSRSIATLETETEDVRALANAAPVRAAVAHPVRVTTIVVTFIYLQQLKTGLRVDDDWDFDDGKCWRSAGGYRSWRGALLLLLTITLLFIIHLPLRPANSLEVVEPTLDLLELHLTQPLKFSAPLGDVRK
jgi:hypothetical protein